MSRERRQPSGRTAGASGSGPASWALNLRHLKVFVLAGAVIWNCDCLGFFLGQTKASSGVCFKGCYCGSQAFISWPTCSVSSVCKACITFCVWWQNKNANMLGCFFFSHKKTEAEEVCANKPLGAYFAEGSQQQQGNHFQTSSLLRSKERWAKQQTHCGKNHWWGLLC